MKEKHKELHEAKTHPNSLQLSSQEAEQMSVTAQSQVMVFTLTIVAVCLAFVYRGWWSVVAGIHACLGVILMLVVAWRTHEVQFWLSPLGRSNVFLDYGCDHGSSTRRMSTSGNE